MGKEVNRFLKFPAVKRGAALAITALAASVGISAAFGQAPSIGLLEGLQKGQWELRFRDGTASRKICVRSGSELIQLRHSGPDCGRYVVDEGREQVTVQYSCKGNGYGRTTIRKETGSLVQISSQGISGDRPFQFTAEARKVGPC